MNNVTTANSNSQSMVNQMPSLKEGACLVVVSVNGACGEAKLPEGKVILEGKEVKSERVKAGTLEWFPTGKLKFVSKASTATSRALNEIGVDLGRCNVIPQASLDSVMEKLEKISSDFYDAVDDLEHHFDKWMDDYIAANPEIANLVKALACTKAEFVGKFKYQVLPPISMTLVSDDIEQIDEMKSDISNNVMQELHKFAAKLFFTISGRDKMHRKLLGSYKKMMSKLYSFGFADLKLLEVYDVMDSELNKLPNHGPIEGDAFNRMVRWTGVLASEHGLALHLSGLDQLAPLQAASSEGCQSTTTTQACGTTASTIQSTDAFEPTISADEVQGSLSTEPANVGSDRWTQGGFGFSNF